MVNLSSSSGLPLWLDSRHGDLILVEDGQVIRARELPQRLARSMLLDPEAPASRVAHRMLPNAVLPVDEGVFAEHRVQHNALLLGSAGAAEAQAYTQVAAEGIAWPAVYGVVYGAALILLKRREGRMGGEVADVRRIEAEAGQKVVVPAGHGIVMANVGFQALVVSNLVAACAWSLERQLEPRPSLACQPVAAGPERAAACRGDGHTEVPSRAPEMGIVEETPLYSAFVHEPQRFAWLQEATPPVTAVCRW